MEITNYGVTLRLITHEDIEKVRCWRNDPKIQQYMEFRDEITPEMQERWFKKVSESGRDFYFIICYKNEEIGLINIKDFNEDLTEGESGVFIYEDKYLNTDISYRAHLCMFDYFFLQTPLQTLIAHILKTNSRAQRFTQFLGYSLSDGQEVVLNQLYTLKKDVYLKNANRNRFILREERMSKRQIEK